MCRRSIGRAVSVLAVVVAAGSPALAQDQDQNQDQARPQKLMAAERPVQSLRAALDLSASDLAVLGSLGAAGPVFHERIGSMEFSGLLLVQVKDEAAMVGAEPGRRMEPATVQAARARIDRARARLAPSLDEWYDDVDLHSVIIPQGWDESSMAAFLMATGDYEYVEPNYRVYPALAPNDPLFGTMTHHSVMNTELAWDHTTGGGLMVGVCDTGVDQDHPDLAAALLPGFNAVTNLAETEGGSIADSNGHGTATTGAAAAIGNNGVGVAGMGWNYQIVPVKVSENPDGTASLGDLTQGARWASDQGARVVSVSFGGVTTSTVNGTGAHIRDEGHLLCWAAGNDGSYLGNFDWPNVIVVGASTNVDTLAGFSNFGPSIDIVAPGINVRTTFNGGGYGGTNGTSLSTPLVNGLLALIWSADLSLTNDEVEQIMYDQAVDLGTPGEDDDFGAGRADAGASVLYAATGQGPRPLPFSDDFNDTLDPNDWKTVSGAAISSAGVNEPSGDSAVSLGATGSITSEFIRARPGLETPVYVSFWAEHRGIAPGGELIVETRDVIGVWRNIATIVSDGSDSEVFGRWFGLVEPLAAWNEMELRFRGDGGEGAGEWFVDDVRVGFAEPVALPISDNFEGSLDDVSVYETIAGAATSAGADNEPSGSNALALGDGDSIETFELPLQELSGTTQYARVWAQPRGVPSGGKLYFEYFALIGGWQPLAEFESDGSDPADFELMQVELPALGFWDSGRVRLRRDAGAGTWYADDLYLGPDELIVNDGCNGADIAEPLGTLDFSDVIAFLSAFGAMQPDADLAEPFGVYDFSDVIAFLGAFGAGCP